MSTYLYGIVPAAVTTTAAAAKPTKKSSAPAGPALPAEGVGNPPSRIRLLEHRDLAALVSDVPDDYHAEAEGIRGMRRDMRVHANVLNRVIESMTVLPFRFGVVLPDDATIVERILRPRYAELTKYLDHLSGAVELTLRAAYVEERVLKEIVAENPKLAGAGRGGGKQSYNAKLETGRRIAAAIQAKQHHDATWLLDALRPHLRDVRVGQPGNDLIVLNASLLVDRKRLQKFDEALAQVHAHETGRMQLDCLGPLPPYSFVELKL